MIKRIRKSTQTRRLTRLTVAVIIFFFCSACSYSASPFLTSNVALNCSLAEFHNLSTNIKIFPTQGGEAKGVFLVTHGLNNKPEVMNALASFLNSIGFNVLRVTLSGHEQNQNWPKCLSASDWIIEMRNAYCQAQVNFPNQRIYGLGYSLGATVTLALMQSFQDVRFEKLILIAPAIKLRWKVNFIKLLSTISFMGFSIPSLSPDDYRAHGKTALRAYSALFDTVDLAEKFQSKEKSDSTMIIQRVADELIDYETTKVWGEKAFSNPKLLTISDRLSTNLPQHLMIDKKSITDFEWENLTIEIEKFLLSSNGDGL